MGETFFFVSPFLAPLGGFARPPFWGRAEPHARGPFASPVAQRHMGSMSTYGALRTRRSPVRVLPGLTWWALPPSAFLTRSLRTFVQRRAAPLFKDPTHLWRSGLTKSSGLAKTCPPYLQYSRMSSRLVLLSGPKWRVRSGAFDAAWCSCNGPWPHQAWRKMAWPLARCGLIEIQCIRRGTRFPCAHRRAPREVSPAADRFRRV